MSTTAVGSARGSVLTRPQSLDEAVAALAADPEAVLLAGGTDLMLELNAGRLRPGSMMALGEVRELAGWHSDELGVWLGAVLTFAQMVHEPLAGLLPALAQAARAIGTPQVRNAATLGGNLGTAAADGDALPVLSALDALVLVHGNAGPRKIPAGEFVLEPGRTGLRRGELIAGVWVPAVRGPQVFSKLFLDAYRTDVSVTVVVDMDARQVRCALGGGPPAVRALEAEAFAAGQIDWAAGRVPDPVAYREFGELVATAAGRRHAGRRHAASVCARRALARAVPTAAA